MLRIYRLSLHEGRAAASSLSSLLLILACCAGLPHPQVQEASPSLSASFSQKPTPQGVDILDASQQWLATFTKGSVTVALHGPERKFAEAGALVEHAVWVRTLPTPFAGRIDESWLRAALQANEERKEDILAIGMEYIAGAAPRFDAAGLQIAGEAKYGPRKLGRERAKGSDVGDYLGSPLAETSVRARRGPEPRRFRSLDCSGYMRMVWGYRDAGVRAPRLASREAGATLHALPEPPSPQAFLSAKLPRTSAAMYAADIGSIIIENRGVQVKASALDQLQVGDVLFFDADPDPAGTIDHVALYLGLDRKEQHRFLSSRKSADGPTMADAHGASILDGNGHFARGFRAAKRF